MTWRSTLRQHTPPLGEYEGAFLPCTFWLATAWAKAGYPDKVQRLLERAEPVAGEQGWFAEAIDPRTMTFLGNFPLLFSQIEYVRAVVETAKAKPLQLAAMAPGTALKKARQMFGSGTS